MFFVRDELESQKLVIFYVVYTIIYFPIIMVNLYWSGGIYTVGKYSFQSVLLIITFAELTKYFASAIYFKKSDYNLLKRHEELTLCSLVKGLFCRSRLKEGCKTILTVLIMTLVYFILSVLYGAEIFTKHEETFMFSALLSVLTVFPICVNLTSSAVMSVIFGCKPNDTLECLMYQNLYLTLIGAWLGAFVIPLDWDRPWQEWPISCSFGAMIGFLISHFIMVFRMTCFPLKQKVHC